MVGLQQSILKSLYDTKKKLEGTMYGVVHPLCMAVVCGRVRIDYAQQTPDKQ